MPGYSNNMAPKMESNKQERSNLLHDNPVARDASGGRPWISKHFKSSMSPLKEGHEGSPAQDAGHGKKFTDEHFPSGKHRNSVATMKEEEEAPRPKKEKKRKAALEQKYNAAVEKHCIGKKH